MTDDLQAETATSVVASGELPAADPGPAPGEPHTQAATPPPGDLPVEDPMDWSWPPYAPLEPAGGRRFDCADWAPSTIVRRPRLRVGRWTVLYRRGS